MLTRHNFCRQLSQKMTFSSFAPVRAADFTHTVIGAGVVGLAVAAELIKQSKNNKVLIIEKNESYGMETSSRNSEVVHAGLYYPPESLKTRMCIRGKQLIYEKKDYFPVKQCGKWIIAQNDEDMEYLHKLHDKAQGLEIPTEFLTSSQCAKIEPKVTARAGALHSPTTGITSAHGLMDFLCTQIQAGPGVGELVLGTKVVGLDHDRGKGHYEIRTISQEDDGGDEEEEFVISSNAVINCAGLYSAHVANMILPELMKTEMYYAKGNYFSYSGPSLGIGRLLYPTPSPNLQGLGTHLTIDLVGQVRFGPDVEWLNQSSSVDSPLFDYSVNNGHLRDAAKAVTDYLPGVQLDQLHGSYSGIRPKLAGPGGGFQDFVVREETDAGLGGFVNMLGIESPGLTSSMALAEHTVERYFSH